ncbi:DUF2959 family protein [Azomonas macrocytogenes]|uniref:Putative nucleic acid-binding Zn-ribbon protein n=1 Tax=Azomonas macrocytogenes TaxID=69962 RepID=A0A839T0Y4_AZOMA|nr:DUF2959 family protein [Azomonas macrocytogenes]MBB3102166.1 putative nucleic acid-binding Zn-ribbon protein [Azomonas macrocytogenes]
MKRPLLVCMMLFILSGCQSAYYSAMERSGVHKRDILVTRVEAARNAQLNTQRQFRDALDRYRSVIQLENGGELERRYESLNQKYEESQSSARKLHMRIESVEEVAGALFDEWEEELDRYSDTSMKAASTRELADARKQYTKLLQSMQAAEERIDPVMELLQDRVLFLKHNLNAKAISSLQGEYNTLSVNIDQLISNMQQAIEESDNFIRTMRDANY